jgi:hypothetical protein
LGIGPFNDKEEEDGELIDLDEIDPFTFFLFISIEYGTKNVYLSCRHFVKKLNIQPIPQGEKGVTICECQSVWLFSWKYHRTNNEIQDSGIFLKVLETIH